MAVPVRKADAIILIPAEVTVCTGIDSKGRQAHRSVLTHIGGLVPSVLWLLPARIAGLFERSNSRVISVPRSLRSALLVQKSHHSPRREIYLPAIAAGSMHRCNQDVISPHVLICDLDRLFIVRMCKPERADGWQARSVRLFECRVDVGQQLIAKFKIFSADFFDMRNYADPADLANRQLLQHLQEAQAFRGSNPRANAVSMFCHASERAGKMR